MIVDIDQAPKSIQAVRNNLTLMQNAISSLSDPQSPVQKLIKELRQKIEPRMEEFVQKANYVMCEYLQMNLREFTLPLAKAKLQLSPPKDPNLATTLGNAIADLEYLAEMRSMEESLERNPLVPAEGRTISPTER
jgi:hypothetical protein